MRIYANEITEKQIFNAAADAGVLIERLRVRPARRSARSLDVILSGSAGRRGQGGDHEAATWDEWGIFLNSLFAFEETITAGPYKDRDHFNWCTGDRYLHLVPADQHNHRWVIDTHTPRVEISWTCSGCPAIKRERLS